MAMPATLAMRWFRTSNTTKTVSAVTIVAAILASLLVFLTAGTVSASTVTETETRVAAQTAPSATGVGPQSPETLLPVGANSAYAYDIMSACCVAPRPTGLPGPEISPGVYESPGGLIYGPGSKHGHRTTHVLEHLRPDASKPAHTVFSTSASSADGAASEVFSLLDEAWGIRGSAVPGDPGKFEIPMGRPVGTGGETMVTIIVVPGTSEVITAFPS